MANLYFITGNAGKFHEVKALIPHIEQLDIDLDEIQSLNPQFIIGHKLNQAAQQMPEGAFIVEDTSLSLNCLNGLPGPYIKWFGKAIDWSGVAELAANYPDQSAVARTVIGYRDINGRNHFVSGEIKGTIAPPAGQGFGWDVIFVPEGYNQTFGELGPDIKRQLSMRRKAVDELKKLL